MFAFQSLFSLGCKVRMAQTLTPQVRTCLPWVRARIGLLDHLQRTRCRERAAMCLVLAFGVRHGGSFGDIGR